MWSGLQVQDPARLDNFDHVPVIGRIFLSRATASCPRHILSHQRYAQSRSVGLGARFWTKRLCSVRVLIPCPFVPEKHASGTGWRHPRRGHWTCLEYTVRSAETDIAFELRDLHQLLTRFLLCAALQVNSRQPPGGRGHLRHV